MNIQRKQIQPVNCVLSPVHGQQNVLFSMISCTTATAVITIKFTGAVTITRGIIEIACNCMNKWLIKFQ